MVSGPVVSFHPVIEGDLFFWERGPVSQEVVEALKSARAVIFPQTVGRELYFLARHCCPRVFPNYDIRFMWEGKVGDACLFWSLGLPHPRTVVYPRVEAMLGRHPEMGAEGCVPPMPFVIKGRGGGEGDQTWLVRSPRELDQVVGTLRKLEWQGRFGFVVQEYVEGLDQDLRVVVVGERVVSYWRESPGTFRKNLARGGRINRDVSPELKAAVEAAVRRLCRSTGINLAGCDLFFPKDADEPLFVEVNYTFGRTGLGGSEAFYELLGREVEAWLAST